MESRYKGFFGEKKKRRKIRSININFEIKMFGNKIIEGLSFLRLNTNEKIRLINYPPDIFYSFAWNLETKDFLEKKKMKKNSID